MKNSEAWQLLGNANQEYIVHLLKTIFSCGLMHIGYACKVWQQDGVKCD